MEQIKYVKYQFAEMCTIVECTIIQAKSVSAFANLFCHLDIDVQCTIIRVCAEFSKTNARSIAMKSEVEL